MATRRSGARERLSRDTIVAGAIALADAEGLDAVTIRRLAQDHEVTPMALYWHFKDKGELLDGIAERLFADMRLPAPSRYGAAKRPISGDARAAKRLPGPYPNAKFPVNHAGRGARGG